MIEVRVPCSTSNLGAGFDCIGLAFNRYLTVRYTPGDGPLRITRGGTVEHLSLLPASDAVVIALRASLGDREVTGEIDMHSDIPIGCGLGSSAAATVAGIAIGYALSDVERRSYEGDALALATRIEGHPDNAAPSLLGGLVGVARGAGGDPHAFRLPLSPAIGFAFAAPSVMVSTAAAREALPQVVSHALAARTLGRTAALVRGLESGDPELVRLGLYDELHVPHRLPLIPGAATAIHAAVAAGAWGATISGSGSGIIAVGMPDEMNQVADAMRGVFERHSSAATVFVLEPDFHGLQTKPWC